MKNDRGTIEHPCMKTTMLIVYLIIVQVFDKHIDPGALWTFSCRISTQNKATPGFHSNQVLKPPISRKRLMYQLYNKLRLLKSFSQLVDGYDKSSSNNKMNLKVKKEKRKSSVWSFHSF